MKSQGWWILLLISLGAFAFAGEQAAAPLSSLSIYNLDLTLTSQSGQPQRLDAYRGQPVLVTMFYASCPAVCPVLIDSVRAIENTLDAQQRSDLRVLFVSIDPERDTPQALSELAKLRKVSKRWTFARAEAGEVRKLAAILKIQYRKLPNGEFNHSSVITLLDRDGVIARQTSKLGAVDVEFASALKVELSQPVSSRR